MKTIWLLAVLGFCCTPMEARPIELTAYDTIVSAKAYLGQVSLANMNCFDLKFKPGSGVLCANLKKAMAAKDLLIDAAGAYCNQSNFGIVTNATGCQPGVKGTSAFNHALAALKLAMEDYKRAEGDLRKVV